ncbi:uncharacterized protein LOC124419715 [Lucilia cuprina]|uniref:uncharacterized protein LOC124419715 n=1 Tax=Lucilia cuprina TaxID=7375 RepID=UPI001F058C78|nr:uncharacterized protein LOC124419715 [Lucilia cuprina]
MDKNGKMFCECKDGYEQSMVMNKVYCCSKPGEICAIDHKCSIDLKCKEFIVKDMKENILESNLTEMDSQLSEQLKNDVYSKSNNPEESTVIEENNANKFFTNVPVKSTVTEVYNIIKLSTDVFAKSTVTEEYTSNDSSTDKSDESTVIEENTANEISKDKSTESTVTEENTTITPQSHEEYTTTDRNADILQNVCEESQKCYGKCCTPNEKCSSEESKCIAFSHRKEAGNIFDLFDFNDSDIITSTITSNDHDLQKDCPPQRQCLRNCCSSHEVCNKENKCVNENPGSIFDLFDFNDSAIIIPTHDEEEEKAKCPNDQLMCKNICCSTDETCSENWKCIPKIEAISSKISNSAIVYTSIGSGCLVAALAFALFKLYNFKSAQRRLF